MRAYTHLTYTARLRMERLFKDKVDYKQIADILKVHISTVYRERKRGSYIKRDYQYRYVEDYSAEVAQARYEAGLEARGAKMKLGNDQELANYIETKIADEKYSPEAVIGEIKAKGLKFKTSICVQTLYSYIDKGVFLRVTNKSLPLKANKKRKYRKVRPIKSRPLGESIEDRPKDVKERNDFGHWEMDTVKGKRSSRVSLLVLTERKTRKEIIMKLTPHSAENVVTALNSIETKLKDKFKKIFKSITCDNGAEFSYYNELKKSIYGGDRTHIYYCHPYSSFERGTNENCNRLIRRHIPKGTPIEERSLDEIKAIEDWINNYPRKIFNYRSAQELFDEEMALIG